MNADKIDESNLSLIRVYLRSSAANQFHVYAAFFKPVELHVVQGVRPSSQLGQAGPVLPSK
jgi:hypothetical protein